MQSIKQNIQNELLLIVHRSTLQVNEYMALQQTSKQSAHSLQELIQTLFDEFRSVGQAHATLLGHLAKASEMCIAKDTGLNVYDMKEFWIRVQEVLKILLTDYLDIQNLSTEPQIAMVYTDSNDLSLYFSRRKVQRYHYFI